MSQNTSPRAHVGVCVFSLPVAEHQPKSACRRVCLLSTCRRTPAQERVPASVSSLYLRMSENTSLRSIQELTHDLPLTESACPADSTPPPPPSPRQCRPSLNRQIMRGHHPLQRRQGGIGREATGLTSTVTRRLAALGHRANPLDIAGFGFVLFLLFICCFFF